LIKKAREMRLFGLARHLLSRDWPNPMKRTLPLAIFALIQIGASGSQASRAPQASFRRDVAPLLTTSCSTRSCHGGMRPPLLGAHDDPQTLRASLLGIASEERPAHAYVSAGHPDDSYLMEKIDGHLPANACVDHDCGDQMPLDNPPLSPEAREAIRAWIEQGASDN
jgi:hypothetical protein